MTQTGEPICLNEYATKIATNSRTQVILLEDFQGDTAGEPRSIDYINRDSKPQELVLESRHGRSRLHHVPIAEMGKLNQFIKNAKENE